MNLVHAYEMKKNIKKKHQVHLNLQSQTITAVAVKVTVFLLFEVFFYFFDLNFLFENHTCDTVVFAYVSIDQSAVKS